MDAYRIAVKFCSKTPRQSTASAWFPCFICGSATRGLTRPSPDRRGRLSARKKRHPASCWWRTRRISAWMNRNGRLGLLYQRKRPFGNSFSDRLKTTLFSALEACLKLEHDSALGGHAKFRTDEFVLRIEDRLLVHRQLRTFQHAPGALGACLKLVSPTCCSPTSWILNSQHKFIGPEFSRGRQVRSRVPVSGRLPRPRRGRGFQSI